MKVCSSCGVSKDIFEFYFHPKTSDGFMEKCKDCHKALMKSNTEKRMQDPEWVAKEAERHREKSKRVRESGKVIKSSFRSQFFWNMRNQHKKSAHRQVSNAIRDGRLERKPCEVCGLSETQAHHDDYSKPLEVRWLCTEHHGEQHRKY